MKLFILLPISILLASCVNSGEAAKNLIDQLQFYEGDEGCIRLHATLDLNPLPLITSTATLDYRKSTGEGAPEC